MGLQLTKNAGLEDLGNVTKLRVGLAWDTSGGGRKGLLGKIKRHVGSDLDLAAVALADGEPVRLAWFDSYDPFGNGSLVHLGDNRSGKGDGDDEELEADLRKIHASINAVVFIVTAYKEGVSFADIANITMRTYDLTSGRAENIGEFWPRLDARENACVMAAVHRTGATWSVRVINEMGNARDRDGMLRLAGQHARP
ncbi:TerD family protein [Streptodolium elevatio]|uniref:TerD family protein n=1 Tax=Streptodolium elevatio TaxID=3157996 RepID=A0ABV3DLK5_9ACTN